MGTFSFKTRNENLARLADEEFDVFVIGGGITGAGVARDAASRGLRVALVEGGDFASGTSSRSSKLIHGGIRYLENKEFGLVFEALSERRRLIEMAPHLVHPLKFTIPLYQGDRVGMGLMGLGMWVYDALALFETPEIHQRLSPQQALTKFPFLRSSGLLGAYDYYDAYMDDDRLVIETLRDANRLGAVIVNYVRAGKAEFGADSKVQAIHVEDLRTRREFRIRARHVISAGGPWTDQLGEAFVSDWKKILRPSKGVHITFDRKRVPLQNVVVMATRADKRIVFAIPRHDMVIIGTTDTDFPQSPEYVQSTADDVDYLLSVANGYFPGLKLTKSDIVASYSGVRPLVDDGSESESKTSREHVIFNDARGFTFVAGGKYTTYRKMAEQTVEKALRLFTLEDRVRFGRSNTTAPLNPMVTVQELERARQLAPIWAERYGMNPNDIHLWVDRHGMEAEELIFLYHKQACRSVWGAEAWHAIENTMCLDLLDFFLRRTPLFLSRRDHGREFLREIVAIFEKAYGWDEGERSVQIEKINQHQSYEMGWFTGI